MLSTYGVHRQHQAVGAISHDHGSGKMRDAPVKDVAEPHMCANKVRTALSRIFSPSLLSLYSLSPYSFASSHTALRH